MDRIEEYILSDYEREVWKEINHLKESGVKYRKILEIYLEKEKGEVDSDLIYNMIYDIKTERWSYKKGGYI